MILIITTVTEKIIEISNLYQSSYNKKISTSVTMHYTRTYCSKLFAVAHLQWKPTFKKPDLLPFEKGKKPSKYFQRYPNIPFEYLILASFFNAPKTSVRTRISFLYFYCLPLTNSIYSANVFEEGWLNWQKLETLLIWICKHWGTTYKNPFRIMNCTHVSDVCK